MWLRTQSCPGSYALRASSSSLLYASGHPLSFFHFYFLNSFFCDSAGIQQKQRSRREQRSPQMFCLPHRRSGPIRSLEGGVAVSSPGLLSSKNRDQSGSDAMDAEGAPVSQHVQPYLQSLQQLPSLHSLPHRHPTHRHTLCVLTQCWMQDTDD